MIITFFINPRHPWALAISRLSIIAELDAILAFFSDEDAIDYQLG